MPTPVIAISLGDPGGIGPEITLKALADPSLRSRAAFRLHGPAACLSAPTRALGISSFWSVVPRGEKPRPVRPASVMVIDDGEHDGHFAATHNAQSGRLSFRAVEDAISAALRPAADPAHADAIVTAPICKKAWALAGHAEFPGHTELLAARCRSDRFAMMFLTPRIRVILATTHIPLARVPAAISRERIAEVITLGAGACARLGLARPRIAVCGLNPHAGEGGLLGTEDEDIIAPAIADASHSGLDCRGPFPGDTIFNAAVAGEYDLVVAMYHDQGLIPVKLLDRDSAVNLTVGLPIIRTSPDHGTAFDIAGRGIAKEGSMKTAIDVAIRLAGSSPSMPPP